jgi:hypothetical protein
MRPSGRKKPGASVYELLITAAQSQQKYNQHTAQAYELTSIVAFGDRSTSDDFITAIWTKVSQ